MQRAGIAGATGYTGSELVQWIQRHPELEVGWITSENSAGLGYFRNICNYSATPPALPSLGEGTVSQPIVPSFSGEG